MKASVLTCERHVVANNEMAVLTVWDHLFEKFKQFFEEPFESDWEKRTGLDWREWGRFHYTQ